jgi:hypothetical protein
MTKDPTWGRNRTLRPKLQRGAGTCLVHDAAIADKDRPLAEVRAELGIAPLARLAKAS